MTKVIHRTLTPKRFLYTELLAWVTGMGAAVCSLLFIDGVNPDVATAYLILLLLAPLGLVSWSRRHSDRNNRRTNLARWFGSESAPAQDTHGWAGWLPWTLAAIVGATSFAASAAIGSQFGDLPPAYHDEYSYLLQAKTFLAGRLSYPSHPTAPRLFDQMHVLNEGRFVSRYFPGVGLWIAPFLAIGHPYWGHWLAGCIAAVFVFWAGRELGGNGVGLLAGMLTALSPGMGLFSNLLLSHHPTLVGLTLFMFAFLRMMRNRCAGYAALAGIGLSYAMLCRPMTAAGVGFPFGVWFFWKTLSARPPAFADTWKKRVGLVTALGIPILAGLLILLSYNRATTGDFWTTPYQLYTDTYTPRHVYGFNNVVRGESRQGPKVIENYDRWAQNLTVKMAAENVLIRLLASWYWTLGIVPLAMATVVFCAAGGATDVRWGVVLAAIVSLHAVHVPYWFVGIMNWHYVFESGPLWALIFAGATAKLIGGSRESGQSLMPIWWSTVTGLALFAIYFPFPTHSEAGRLASAANGTTSGRSRLDRGIEEIAFPRHKYDVFRRAIEEGVDSKPALVLVDPDPADRHIDYVVNDPALDAEVLFGRYDPNIMTLARVQSLFPHRTVYIFHVTAWKLERPQRKG